MIEGTPYTQSGTVAYTFTAASGCDSVVITILQLVITHLETQCQPNLTVTLPVGDTTTIVDYDSPMATTDCPDASLHFTLVQGLPPGAAFPEGVTQVCYEAANQCGIRDTCCFQITVVPLPCEAQTPAGCNRYELLGIQLDSLGQRQYQVRLVNTCGHFPPRCLVGYANTRCVW